MSDGLALWVVATLLVTAGIVAACAVAERRRVRRLADQLSTWLGSTGYRPLSGGGSQAWRRLGIVLNAIGAAFERRGAELALERPWRYRLVDALVDPALLFSTAGRLLAANDAARHLFGIPVDAVAVTVVQAVGSATLAAAVREVQRTDSHLSIDVEHGDHDLRAVVTRIGDESLLVIRDRTREHRVEELRRNFVVNASHELKSPVTGIQTLTEALRVTVDRDPDRIRSLLRRLDQEAERLARLVHELLDLRRLEERGPLERAPVDLAELVRRVVAGMVDRAGERTVELWVKVPDRAFVAGVRDDIQLIIENLAGNALQYNEPGGRVDITISPQEGSYVLTVRDTGIGIPQQDLTRIFERFYRVDPARSRESGGTGLGLSIVRHAVERQGGTIRVDSLLGEGTTFTVTLPIDSA